MASEIISISTLRYKNGLMLGSFFLQEIKLTISTYQIFVMKSINNNLTKKLFYFNQVLSTPNVEILFSPKFLLKIQEKNLKSDQFRKIIFFHHKKLLKLLKVLLHKFFQSDISKFQSQKFLLSKILSS